MINANLTTAYRFLRYYFSASTVFDLQSPMAYAFAREVLEDRRTFYVFSEAESLRQQWLRDRGSIRVSDFGAGSLSLQGQERVISDLAKRVATPPQFCRWLFHIARFGQPATMLELGTSLGISAIYQSAAAPHAKFITLEGCPETAGLARRSFQQLHCRAELQVGRFDALLPSALDQLGKLDHLYLDGDHSLEGTLKYLEECRRYSHPGTVWVIGDIHWSEGMERAWETVKAMPGVKMTIDLFGMGVVLFRQEIPVPVHFVLAPSLWKPWHLGRWGGL